MKENNTNDDEEILKNTHKGIRDNTNDDEENGSKNKDEEAMFQSPFGIPLSAM